MRRDASTLARDAFLTGGTFWPNGAKTSKLKVVTLEGTSIAFSYGEPIAVRKPRCPIYVVGWDTLMPEMPGVFEWSMTTANHISTMLGVSWGRHPRKVKRVTRQRLHAILGWPCDPLPAVCRVRRAGANKHISAMGREYVSRVGSKVVDPSLPPVQWAQTYMGMYD